MLHLLRALRLRSASGHRTFSSRRRPQRSTAAPGFHFAPAEECEPRVLLSATGGVDDYAAWRNATFTVDSLTVSTDIVTTQSDEVSAYDSQTTTLIGLDGVFESTSYRGTGYSVAVIDTGIDYSHPALGGGWGNRVIAGYDFVNGDADPMDDNGHGTHVAGIIGSSDATHYGIAPDVNLIALKVLGADGSGSFGAVEDALQWVIAHQSQYNIVAVNMSLGAGNFSSNPYSFLEDEFSTLVAQGVFVAGASGNSFYSYGSQQGLGYPAISTQTVSVGAVWDANVGSVSWGSGARDYATAADRVTSFTQRSSSLDILAPGAFVTSTYLGGGFATLAGTSMATPVIAGAAALLHQAAIETGQMDLANQSSLLDLIQTTGVDVIDGDDENDNVTNTGLTFKRLDLLAAMNVLVGESAPANEAPTISDIENQTIVEDGTSGALAFSVSDIETTTEALAVTAFSSNATLIPNENLTLVDLGDGNWTIQAAPAANQYGGPATITITVDDGTTTTDLTFDITVTPTNDAPAISDIENQTIVEDGTSEALAFSVSDLETAAGSLTVTAASSNTTLIPNENLTLVDLGNGNWTIQAAPAANQFGGPATITITVDDGTTTTDLTFDITVTPDNDAPTISDIENQTIVEDGSSEALAFSVSDLETAAGSLTVTATSSNAALIPNENLTLVDLGNGNWTIQAAPAANQFGGPATITITVYDGTTTTDLTFDITVTPDNDAPTISDIENQTIVEDGSSEALAFSVSDLETAAGSLTVTATSSNATLIPNDNLTLVDLGNGNWTIQATPAANQYGGPATITITVDDGTTTTDLTFDITVTPANDAPTISDIENQTIVEDGSSEALAFSVSDLETAAGTLTVTAASSNTTLIPNENLTLVDLGNGNWTIQAAPAANQFGGPATITLTVDDGTTTTDLTFDITVTPTNDAPAISDIENQTIVEDGTSEALAFSVSDLETAAGSLTVTATSSNATLIPNDNLTLVDLGNGNWTIQATPAANQYGGPTTITITVDDGTTTADLTFDITVTPDNDAPTISDIENQTIVEDGVSEALAFSVSDVETAAGSLTVTAASSNATLIPNENLTLVDLGNGNWTIQAAPAANQFGGPATITVTVNDGTTTTDLTFDITVTPANDAPTISDIGNQQRAARGGAFDVSVNASDPDDDTVTLSAALADGSTAASVAFDGSILTVTPSDRFAGQFEVLVTAFDGELSTLTSFTVTVESSLDVSFDSGKGLLTIRLKTPGSLSVSVDSGNIVLTNDGLVQTVSGVAPDDVTRLVAYGTDGDDTIDLDLVTSTEFPHLKAVSVFGLDGDDNLTGSGFDDLILAGPGNDTVDGGDGSDRISGEDGNDQLNGGRGADRLTGGGGDDLIAGNDDDDQLIGGDGNDTLNGGAGNDVANGGSGTDQLNGDAGNDRLKGGDDNDTIDGGAGNDALYGDAGNDLLRGGDGNDQLRGNLGNDTVDGGAGNDRLYGGGGNDVLSGDDGRDRLYGQSGHDTLLGGDGNDILDGGNGNDHLDGNRGKDQVISRSGLDVVSLEFARGDRLAGDNYQTVSSLELSATLQSVLDLV